jgi:hypothetical protein
MGRGGRPARVSSKPRNDSKFIDDSPVDVESLTVWTVIVWSKADVARLIIKGLQRRRNQLLIWNPSLMASAALNVI